MNRRILSLGVCVLVTGLIFIFSPSLASANGMPYMPLNEGNSGVEVLEGESIFTVVADENIVYLGGDFTAIGYSVGRGAIVSAITSSLLIPDFPRIYAATGSGVDVAITSQAGDIVYIGGKFFQIGPDINDANLNLVRSNPDGSIDGAFLPKPNGEVRDLAISSDGAILYVAGDFTMIGGQARNHLAAIDTATGQVTDWDPNANQAVLKLMLSKDDDTLYAGGSFTSIVSTARNYIAALDVSTTTPTLIDWDPNANEEVYSLMLNNDDSVLYVGGKFTNIVATNRNHIAALDVSTTTPTLINWDPNINDNVREIVLNASGTLAYIGGDFTSIATSTTRNYVAALDTSTATTTAWDPNVSIPVGGYVKEIVLNEAEDSVYIGGDFIGVGGQIRLNIARVNAANGFVDLWEANTSGKVNVIYLSSDEELAYVAGIFNTICLQLRNGLAAIDIHNNDILVFDPDPDDVVRTLALSDDGNTLYVGGDFTNIGSYSRNHLAAIDTNTDLATAWNPDPAIAVGTTSVFSIALDEPQSLIYVGGEFDSIGGENRDNLAAVGLITATSTDWSPNPNGEVDTLAIPPDSTAHVLAISGEFTQVLSATRTRFALLDTSTSTFAFPDMVLDPDSVINSFVFRENGSLYFGGNFTNIGGESRNGLASFDPDTGTISSWDPDVLGSVYSLSLYPGGGALFVGGAFTQIGTTTVNNLAAVDTLSGDVWQWDNTDPSGPIYSLSSDPGSFNLFVGGNFAYINNTINLERHSFAVYTYPGIVLNIGDASIAVTEGGQTDTFQLRLVGQPEADVRLDLTTDSEVVVSPTSLTFTPYNWYIPQTVTVQAVDDHDVEGNHTGGIVVNVVTSDVDYNGMPWLDIEVYITDNDTANNGPTGSIIPSTTTTTTTITTTTTTKPITPEEEQSNCPYFQQKLSFGDRNEEVKKVQTFLIEQGFLKISSGTGYFGVLTQNAVKEFQKKYAEDILKPLALTEATGYWFTNTINKANQLMGCQVGAGTEGETPITTIPETLVLEKMKQLILLLQQLIEMLMARL